MDALNRVKDVEPSDRGQEDAVLREAGPGIGVESPTNGLSRRYGRGGPDLENTAVLLLPGLDAPPGTADRDTRVVAGFPCKPSLALDHRNGRAHRDGQLPLGKPPFLRPKPGADEQEEQRRDRVPHDHVVAPGSLWCSDLNEDAPGQQRDIPLAEKAKGEDFEGLGVLDGGGGGAAIDRDGGGGLAAGAGEVRDEIGALGFGLFEDHQCHGPDEAVAAVAGALGGGLPLGEGRLVGAEEACELVSGQAQVLAEEADFGAGELGRLREDGLHQGLHEAVEPRDEHLLFATGGAVHDFDALQSDVGQAALGERVGAPDDFGLLESTSTADLRVHCVLPLPGSEKTVIM